MKTLILDKWTTKAGLEAMAVLLSEGYINGYVEVPKEFYGKDWSSDIAQLINVHGGVTYTGNNLSFMDRDKWYFGFDTAHASDGRDYCMVLDKMYDILDESEINDVKNQLFLTIEYYDPTEKFRDENYVKEQCENMAIQLIELLEKWHEIYNINADKW